MGNEWEKDFEKGQKNSGGSFHKQGRTKEVAKISKGPFTPKMKHLLTVMLLQELLFLSMQ